MFPRGFRNHAWDQKSIYNNPDTQGKKHKNANINHKGKDPEYEQNELRNSSPGFSKVKSVPAKVAQKKPEKIRYKCGFAIIGKTLLDKDLLLSIESHNNLTEV